MIQSQNNAVTYAVSGNEYIFPYKFFTPSDLTLYLDSRILVKDIDWTIENKEDYSGGAKIFLKEGVQGKRLTIMRVLPCTQGASFPTYGKLDSKTLENALDKLTMIAQQIQEENSRTIKTSPTDETTADALLQSIYTSANGAVAAAAAAGQSAQQAALTAKAVEDAGKAAVDAAGEAASEAAGSAAEVREALRKSAGIPIGAIFSSPGAVPPEGAYLLNGQTIAGCNELYPKFWEWVQSAGVRIIDNDTYEAEIASAGVCGGFVDDTAAGSVRLPTLINGTLWGADSATVGQSLAAGLPNITGEWQAVHGTYEGGNNYFDVEGAIKHIASENSRNGKDVRGNTSSTAPSDRLGFDASRSNSIYGNSDTVQPPAIRVSWCIQVYNAATSLSEQESAQLAVLVQTKAQTDLANITEAGKNVIRKESAMRVWESGEQSITNSTLYQLTHDLDLTYAEIRKARARIVLKCITAEHGYQAGDYVYMPSDNVINQETWTSQPVVRSNSVVWCKSSGNFWINPVSGGGGYINANNANWKMIFQIFY